MSRLSRGNVPSVPSHVPSVPRTFCLLNRSFHINRPNIPGVHGTSRINSWDCKHQIPLCDFSLLVFSLPSFRQKWRTFLLLPCSQKKCRGWPLRCVIWRSLLNPYLGWNLELPTRHASVSSTHSNTQASPAFHCTDVSRHHFCDTRLFQTRRQAVYQCYMRQALGFF